MARTPVFIPRDKMDPNKEYRGYIATPEGVLLKSAARFTGFAHDRSGRFKQPVGATHGNWDVQPSRKRTPQERLESLASRIWAQNTQGALIPGPDGTTVVAPGIPESVAREALQIAERIGTEGVSDAVIRSIQAIAARAGKLTSFEDCKALAALYLGQAEKEWDEANRKRVTRRSAHVLDPDGTGRQGA